MKRALILSIVVAAMGLSGCGPKEDPSIAIAAAEEAARVKAERQETFGAAAQAEDITWRPSGLGVRVDAPGEGAVPQLADTVRVHYVGTLKDGTVFDESRSKGTPRDFPLRHVMASWAAGLSQIKEGGRITLFVPPSLGYGGQRAGNIPPNSGLIFEIELLAINPEPLPKAK
jgi:FKBP-type peptidyl-prolyl cis-trans isomerase